jgi:hypothetical protein
MIFLIQTHLYFPKIPGNAKKSKNLKIYGKIGFYRGFWPCKAGTQYLEGHSIGIGM